MAMAQCTQCTQCTWFHLSSTPVETRSAATCSRLGFLLRVPAMWMPSPTPSKPGRWLMLAMWADVGCWAASCMFQFPSGNTRPNNSAWIPVWKCDRFNMLQPGLFELPFAALKPLMKSQPSRHLLQTLVMHGVHQLLRMSTRRMASCWLPRVHGYIISSYVAICRL